MVACPKPQTTKLLKFGNDVGVILPASAARACTFRAGSFVRVIVLPGEIRVRPVSQPRLTDEESIDEWRDRLAREELEESRREEDEI